MKILFKNKMVGNNPNENSVDVSEQLADKKLAEPKKLSDMK